MGVIKGLRSCQHGVYEPMICVIKAGSMWRESTLRGLMKRCLTFESDIVYN